jgi:hypothetical protein
MLFPGANFMLDINRGIMGHIGFRSFLRKMALKIISSTMIPLADTLHTAYFYSLNTLHSSTPVCMPEPSHVTQAWYDKSGHQGTRKTALMAFPWFKGNIFQQ